MKKLNIDITVRMYNVGFGDCFLITVPTPKKPYKILVDCGVHSGGPGPRKIRETVKDIVKATKDDDDVSRIDVVVATHRHADHVSGFEEPDWARVEVGEVWLPWTEDREDAVATALRQKMSKAAKKVHKAALGLLRANDPRGASATALAENLLVNAAAMETLHTGFDGSPTRRFLPNKDAPAEPLRLPGLDDAIFHVLGPSREESVIRDLDPPEGESYLAMVGDDGKPFPPWEPFSDRWTIPPRLFTAEPVLEHLHLTPEMQDYIQKLRELDAFSAAVALTSAVNGTSLMLMFEIGGAFLLFPGDAQWGTWKAAIKDNEQLLRKTTFYKVGHHGSHNATPRDFFEHVLDNKPQPKLRAMVSTRKTGMWDDLPRAPLLKKLNRITEKRWIRSDTAQREVIMEPVVPPNVPTFTEVTVKA